MKKDPNNINKTYFNIKNTSVPNSNLIIITTLTNSAIRENKYDIYNNMYEDIDYPIIDSLTINKDKNFITVLYGNNIFRKQI